MNRGGFLKIIREVLKKTLEYNSKPINSSNLG